LDIKDHHSIELSLNLCFKEEISQIIMELEENRFMEKNSQIKTLNKNIPPQAFFPWLMQVKIQMDLNFSSQLYHALGLMANMLFSEKLQME
jgi:hypothetical protein